MQWILKRIFGTKNQRDINRLVPLVERINAFEEEYQALSEDDLKGMTGRFRERLAAGETIDDIMCEAFAVVKNACRRLMGTPVAVCGHTLTWDMIPYDVQLMGAIVLHQGKIAEMQTGEGKTLVATMPLYLNALSGQNVHLVTVNDYLASRDSQWMGHIYTYLGLTVGCIQNQMNPTEKRAEYGCDITYGMNSEFGFDYLRDNGMAYRPEDQVQRGHFYAIIDETDNILIDEARTPLIISGPAPTSSHQYDDLKPKVERLVRLQRELCNQMMADVQQHLNRGETEAAQLKLYQVHHAMPKHKQLMRMLEDPKLRKLHEQIENAMLTDMRKEEARALREELYFSIDERGHDASLTDMGCEALNPSDPEAFVLPDLLTAMAEVDREDMSETERAKRRQEIQALFAERSERIHNVDQLIRAYCVYERDVEYVVQGNQVIIVDEFTGRMMPGRRWSDGLHQAVEAKEGVKIERETQTLATITIQNYFRLYDKLAGMTGTAETEADEFHQIYKLDVVVMPTNRPIRRIDHNDVIYKTQREKFKAIVDDVVDCQRRGQPVLVGTVTVDASEVLSRMLRRANIPHTVLNAKQHEREAEIVTGAGQRGAVTIATNMAGRGTDIKLGEGVVSLPREVITSSLRLGDRYAEHRSLKDYLLEHPCGLYVIGSARHESRRIDRQLRGRCARQGDPGVSRFYISLEDELMRLFGSERISNVMSKLGLEEGQDLQHGLLNRSIETAQRRVEQQNFAIRKRTLEYDDVMNKQREVIYGFRGEIVRSENVRERIYDIIHESILDRADALPAAEGDAGVKSLVEWVRTTFPIALDAAEIGRRREDPEAVATFVFDKVKHAYELKIKVEHPEALQALERQIVLHAVDTHWQEYLRAMDGLRQGVGLRAYGQRDPLVEYKREAFDMFEVLMEEIKADIVGAVFRSSTSIASFDQFLRALPQTLVHDEVSMLEGRTPAAGGGGRPGAAPRQAPPPDMADLDDLLGAPTGGRTGVATTPVRHEPKVGRNDPCPCGSGKKYKKCCGA